ELEMPVRLRQQRVDRIWEVLRPVVQRHPDADERRWLCAPTGGCLGCTVLERAGEMTIAGVVEAARTPGFLHADGAVLLGGLEIARTEKRNVTQIVMPRQNRAHA